MGPSLHWVLARLIALVLTAVPGLASAWGAQAHRLVASLAWTQLTPATQAEVSRLLALEPDSSFESISTWADEVRSPSTASWHYLNFPRDASCRYEAMRSCPSGHCVVAAIQRQLGVLRGPSSDPDRLKALKYLVHLVADVHQPLHAGFADDRGGNQPYPRREPSHTAPHHHFPDLADGQRRVQPLGTDVGAIQDRSAAEQAVGVL
jgi:nuclease S1